MDPGFEECSFGHSQPSHGGCSKDFAAMRLKASPGNEERSASLLFERSQDVNGQ
jgi:hypothetical protein